MSDGVRAMNAALGTNYRLSRVREWEAGKRQASPDAMQYMLVIVLEDALRDAGLNKKEISEVIRKCKLPRKNIEPS